MKHAMHEQISSNSIEFIVYQKDYYEHDEDTENSFINSKIKDYKADELNQEKCYFENQSESKEKSDFREYNNNFDNKLNFENENKPRLSRYEHIIRTEIKLKNGKLNSNKAHDKKNGKANIRTKELKTYYNKEAFEIYHYNMFKEIFGKEPFYRLDIAKQIVINSNEKTKTKEKLCSLLELINLEGYTEAEKIWTNTFSRATFYSHIKKIRSLGINILTFSKIINGIEIPYEMIPNFALLENSEFAE